MTLSALRLKSAIASSLVGLLLIFLLDKLGFEV